MLQAVYRMICRLHDIPVALQPEAYVRHQVGPDLPGMRLDTSEMVWIVEDEESVNAVVYLEPSLLEQLAKDNPLQRLHAGNIGPFCAVVEGMSHLALLSERVQCARNVSALELEIQAEVDKFMLLWRLLISQGYQVEQAAWYVGQCLFEAYMLNAFAKAAYQERYVLATKVAKGFCLQELRQDWQHPARMLALCRLFVRRPLAHKLRGYL